MLQFVANLLLVMTFGFPVGDYLRQNYNLVEQPQTILQIPRDVVNKISRTPEPSTNELPTQKLLTNNYHTFQTFNNCGPASLSMTLSYFGINESQQTLGQALRPYQVASGDNDDKSTTLPEMAEKARDYGLVAYHRPAGTTELVKRFILEDIPVITRTWTKPNEDIGHYRVVKGYDDLQGQFIQDDSLQGKNLRYSYSDFNILWEKFNYEYLVLVPEEKQQIAEYILGENTNPKNAWSKAVQMSREKLAQNPSDVTSRFNLSVALFNIGDYQGTAAEFEKVENQLPFRALWYQTEPIEAYYLLKNYNRVFEITDKILNNGNRAYSEAYILRGDVYRDQGNISAARSEYEKAVLYNKNLKIAQERLSSVQ